MNTMIKAPMGLSLSQLLKVAILTVALTLTGCGGGGSSQTLLQQVQALIATGTAANLETAMDLLLANQDKLAAADFEALMDAIAAA